MGPQMRFGGRFLARRLDSDESYTKRKHRSSALSLRRLITQTVLAMFQLAGMGHISNNPSLQRINTDRMGAPDATPALAPCRCTRRKCLFTHDRSAPKSTLTYSPMKDLGNEHQADYTGIKLNSFT
jgi:hypothetical protein